MKSMTIAVLIACSSIAFAQVNTPRPSPKSSVSQTIGITEVKITYSRPGVKNRTIWGELVPYDTLWRTGANEATTVSFSDDVKVEGQALPKGTYALFTIPGKTEWTVIFNKNADQSGTGDYKQEQDALRFKVKPDTSAPQEWMVFTFQGLSRDSADVVMRWEKLALKFNIRVNTTANVLAHCREAMPGLQADDWRSPYRCASFVFENEGDAAEAMKWLDQSISIKEGFFNLNLKAEQLAKAGKRSEALASAKKALTLTENVPEDSIAELKKKVEEWSGSN